VPWRRRSRLLLGCVHGLNFVLLFVVANMLLAEAGPAIRPPDAAASRSRRTGRRARRRHLAIVGTVFSDNLVSLPILAATIIILRNQAELLASSAAWPGRVEIVALLASGALIGLATV